MTILDSLMVFSENQHISHTTADASKGYLATNYIDLGVDSKDYWGDGKTTRPGWWVPDTLMFIFKFGATIPTTADAANSYLGVQLFGTSVAASVTVTSPFATAYRYFVGGQARKDWAKTYPHSIIFQATIPQVFHRYLFVIYEVWSTYYAYVDAWAGFGAQFLSSIKNPEYPGSIA